MSETVVGVLGLLCIVAIVVTLFTSKTLPSIAFIVFPTILGIILVIGGYYNFEQLAEMVEAGFKSTGPTAALFVFSVLYFGIMTDAGMFDVIIGNLMKFVGKQEKERLLADGDDDTVLRTRELLETMDTLPEFLPDFDGEIFTDLVKRITADGNGSLRFRLKNGLELTEAAERSVR